MKDRYDCTCGREVRVMYIIDDGTNERVKGCKICTENDIIQYDKSIPLTVWKYSFYNRKCIKAMSFGPKDK